ncbi:nucleoside recognition domain-containing protein [Oleiphilus messinensis]|uniref:Nucleoside recognition domain-containing protein n=1 Tax=Oleiphilus messinensis TaxID=141451 RepID=A0A1Y0IEF2_9GAMM|nr:hypothetical protein [Oleiphilus messinensis]ARU58650.1 nucleoside recognition domain-containing protein [Oleiphilus messinensis]
MNKLSIKQHLAELGRDILSVTGTLFRIMIPALIIIKILEQLGGIELLSQGIAPIMGFVGLPDSMGIVWATTMVTNIYTGLIVFFNTASATPLTVTQVTVLGGMMIIAHSLPIEVRVAQQAGVRVIWTLLLRIGGAILFGKLLELTYGYADVLQETNHVIWEVEPKDSSLPHWAWEQVTNLVMVFFVIAILLTALRVLRVLGIEYWIGRLLAPFLKLLGIGPQATTITLVGITLGLSFGGGLLIKEARAGHLPSKDVFSSMSLLALCHSLLEDTLLILLMGAHLSGILWLRLIFAFVVIALIARLIDRCSESFRSRWLFGAVREP